MSLPLAGLSVVLATLGGSGAGLEDGPSIVPIAALALLAAVTLAMSGALLLWGHQLAPAPRSAAVRPSTPPQVRSRRPSAPSRRRLSQSVMLARRGPVEPSRRRA